MFGLVSATEGYLEWMEKTAGGKDGGKKGSGTTPKTSGRGGSVSGRSESIVVQHDDDDEGEVELVRHYPCKTKNTYQS